jgi:transposase
MLTITDKHKVFLSLPAIDFRTRLEGTLGLCRQQLQMDPQCGHVFIFRNRKLTTLRCIIYDKGGFWLMEKRLSKGRYHYWPQSPYDTCELTPTQLMQLVNNQLPLPG